MLLLNFMMKILFISTILFFMPVSMTMFYSMFLLLVMILILDMNNFIYYSSMFNMDLISMSMMLLSIYILILMKLSQFLSNYFNSLFFMFLMLNLSLMFSFSTNNIIMFYFYFEWSLIPIFFIIIGWGYQMERMKSSFYLLMYTLFASLPLLVFIIMLMNFYNSLLMNFINMYSLVFFYNMYMIMMVISFMVKFPMFFFHQWLPKAHVEAPVGGSMILAGILLKLGGYGLIRMLMFLHYSNIMLMLMIFSLLGGSMLSIVCLMNSDMKVMIAYSSVVHMALIIVNILSKNFWSMNGTMIIMLAHGICSSGMFSCANMMYERSHSRSIMLNKAKLNLFPMMSSFWFLLCMANFGGPFTYNLLGEILLIINLNSISSLMLMLVLIISFFSATYSIILYSNLQQGMNNNLIFNMSNFYLRELLILFSHIWPLLILLFSSMMI